MPALTLEAIDEIIQIAAKAEIVKHNWKDRGKAPISYIKGMAVVYGSVLCKFLNNDPVALEMAKAKTNLPGIDVLAWYDEEFRRLGMTNDATGVDTLRHLFILLIGLGMRESSGRYCTGRDTTASNTTADTAEAGLFQTSHNAAKAHTLMRWLFNEYLQSRHGCFDIFKQGIKCRPADLENFGEGQGMEFQRLSKDCPAFAAEFAALGLRNLRSHWGPVNRREVEIRVECDELLLDIQSVVDRLVQ